MRKTNTNLSLGADAFAISRRGLLGAGGAFALTGITASIIPGRGRAQAGVKLNVINSGGNVSQTLIELLNSQGYLEDFNVEVDTITAQDTNAIMAGLISGRQDVCMWSGINTLFPAIENGADLKIIGGSTIVPQYGFFSANPEVQTLADLEGKTVGVGALGALTHAVVVALLLKNDIDPANVTFVNVGSSANAFKSASAKAVDAALATSDYLDIYQDFGLHILEGGRVWETLSDYTFQGAYATGTAIAEKREALVGLLASYAKMYRLISAEGSKDTFVAAGVAALGDKQAEGAASMWSFMNTNQTLAVDIELDEARIQRLQQLNVDLGVQTEVLPYDQVTDMSLARDALKLLG